MPFILPYSRTRARRKGSVGAARPTLQPVAWTVLAIGIAAGSAQAEPLTLAAAEARLTRDNPSLAAAAQRIRALQSRADAATRLPDPKVSVDAVNLPTNSFSLTQQGMTMLSFGVSQDFPAIGQLELKGRQLHAEAAGQHYGREASRAELVLGLRRAWLAAVYTIKAEAVVEQQERLARENESSVLADYRAAKTPQSDVLGARLAVEQLRNDLTTLHADEAAELARIAEYMGGGQPPDIVADWPDLPQPGADAQAGLARQPLVRQAGAKVRAAEIGVRLAKKAYEPAFSLGASYGKSFVPGSPNFFSAGISFSVPLFAGRRIGDEVDAAGAQVMEARFAEQDQRLALIQEIRSATARWQSAHATWSRETTRMLPLARDALRATLATYASAQTGLGEVLKAQQAVFTTQMRALQERRDQLAAQARLDELTTRSTEQQP